MPANVWNADWLAQNLQRRYPLAEDAGGVDQSGVFRIPRDFIGALDLPVHAGHDVDPTRFFILHVGAYATGYSVTIGYAPINGDPVVVATAMIPRQTHTKYSTYSLGGQNDFDDTVGKICVGDLTGIDEQPPGFFTFDLQQTRLDPDAVRPQLRGVSALVIDGQRLYGDIELVAGENIQLLPITSPGTSPQIRISAISGEGLNEQCVCEGQALPPPIRRINGIPAGPNGDFTFIGDDCQTITAIQNGLQFRDDCSRPCCGCEEMETVTRALEQFGERAQSLTNFMHSLESRVTQMDAVVLGSKLNDQGCSSG